MNNNVEYFEWSDAWVLTSLFMYSTDFKNLNLVNILANGDALNHAVFEFNELQSGFSKLVLTKLINVTENQIKLTKLGGEVKTKSEKLKGGLFEKVDNTLKIITQLECQVDSNDILAFDFLNEKKLNKAYTEYKQ